MNPAGYLKALTERIEVLPLYFDAGLNWNVRKAARVRKETPACVLKQCVYVDAGGRFFHAESGNSSSDRRVICHGCGVR